MKRINTRTLQKKKNKHEPIAMITAYDYPTAVLVDEAGVDVILVGDSLGMVVLGYDSTVPVTLADMVHHTKAVARGAQKSMVVADLPYLTYHGSIDRTMDACAQLIQEAGAQAVKLEGGQEVVSTVRHLTSAAVPVMGHIGLTPQSVYQEGGYRIPGKNVETAQKLIDDAQALEQAGVFALVLECVPAEITASIQKAVQIPVIGIGSGKDCDGQVLVFHDIVDYTAGSTSPSFSKTYVRMGELVSQAVQEYVADVKARTFPTTKHAFGAEEAVVRYLDKQKVNKS